MKFRTISDNSNITIDEADGQQYDLNNDDNAAEHQQIFEAGVLECHNNLQPQIDALQERVAGLEHELPVQLNNYFAEFEAQVKGEIIDLSFFIAEMILQGSVKDAETVKGVIEGALKPVINTQGIRIHLHPDVVQSINTGDDYGIPLEADLVADQRLKPGETLIDCDQGFIDGTLRGRLETLRENIVQKIYSDEEEQQNV